MSERACIRGCARRGIHYATCTRHGAEYEGAYPCTGCAPRECRDGSLICDRCFGRMRALLADVPDLLGRMYSIGDPMKATPTDKQPGGTRSTEPPAPVGADLLDAIADVEPIRPWAHVDLAEYTNDGTVIGWLASAVLDRHPEVEGIRLAWSVQDAVDKWGVERRTKNEPEWMEDVDYDEPVARPEWGDPLLNRDDAGKLAGSLRTLRRWKKEGLIEPEGEIYIAGIRTVLYRRSDVIRVREEKHKKVGRPRNGGTEVGRL